VVGHALVQHRDGISRERLIICPASDSPPTRVSPHGPAQVLLWYGGVTHLRATLTPGSLAGFSVLLTGDNLLNKQTGEPDNSAVRRGRTARLDPRAF